MAFGRGLFLYYELLDRLDLESAVLLTYIDDYVGTLSNLMNDKEYQKEHHWQYSKRHGIHFSYDEVSEDLNLPTNKIKKLIKGLKEKGWLKITMIDNRRFFKPIYGEEKE